MLLEAFKLNLASFLSFTLRVLLWLFSLPPARDPASLKLRESPRGLFVSYSPIVIELAVSVDFPSVSPSPVLPLFELVSKLRSSSYVLSLIALFPVAVIFVPWKTSFVPLRI